MSRGMFPTPRGRSAAPAPCSGRCTTTTPHGCHTYTAAAAARPTPPWSPAPQTGGQPGACQPAYQSACSTPHRHRHWRQTAHMAGSPRGLRAGAAPATHTAGAAGTDPPKHHRRRQKERVARVCTPVGRACSMHHGVQGQRATARGKGGGVVAAVWGAAARRGPQPRGAAAARSSPYVPSPIFSVLTYLSIVLGAPELLARGRASLECRRVGQNHS